MRRDHYESADELVFDLDVKDEGVDPILLERLKNELQWEVINNPLTLGPFAIGAGSLAYALALAPFFGGFLIALPVGVASLLLAAANGGIRLIRVGEKYEEKISELESEHAKEREDKARQKIEQSVRFLRVGFEGANTPEAKKGLKELRELTQAYDEMNRDIPLSKGGRLTSAISDRFKDLTNNAYKQGLATLLCVLSLLREDPSLNRAELKNSIGKLESEIESLRHGKSKGAARLLVTREKELFRMNDRLKKVDWRDATIEEYLERADACEEVIRSAREDLIRVRADNTAEALESAMSQLDSYASILIDVHEQVKKAKEFNV